MNGEFLVILSTEGPEVPDRTRGVLVVQEYGFKKLPALQVISQLMSVFANFVGFCYAFLDILTTDSTTFFKNPLGAFSELIRPIRILFDDSES